MCRCHDIILTDAGVVGAGEPCITLDTVARLQLSFSCSSWRREQPMKVGCPSTCDPLGMPSLACGVHALPPVSDLCSDPYPV